MRKSSLIKDEKLYQADYFYQYVDDPRRTEMYALERAWVIRHLLEHDLMPTTMSGKLLDIGCGLGDFLSGFGDQWMKFGTEPSFHAAHIARSKGIDIISDLQSLRVYGDLTGKIREGFCDAVFFRGTLQHISTPIEVLADCVDLLRPGGLLFVLATPDTDSIVYKLSGKLPALDPDRNWIPFGHEMLTNIMVRMNCRLVDSWYPYRDTPYANPIKDVVEFVNLLTGGIYEPFAWPGNMMNLCFRKVR